MNSNSLNCINSTACICASTIFITEFRAKFRTQLIFQHKGPRLQVPHHSSSYGILSARRWAVFLELGQHCHWRTLRFCCCTINDIQIKASRQEQETAVAVTGGFGDWKQRRLGNKLRFMDPMLRLVLNPTQLPFGPYQQLF